MAWTQQTIAYRRVNAGADIAATLLYVLLNQACYLGIELFGCVRHAGDYAATNRGPSSRGVTLRSTRTAACRGTR